MNTRKKVEAIIEHIVANRIDITAYEPDWFRIACALANEFGESGRKYFHQISQFHQHYEKYQADAKFTHTCRNKYSCININTFFNLVKQNQIIIYSNIEDLV